MLSSRSTSKARRAFALVSYFLVASVSFGCGGSNDTAPDTDPTSTEPPPIPNDGPALAPTSLDCPNGTPLNYENFGEGFMLNYCTMCHSQQLSGADRAGAPVGVDFDQVEDIALWRASIADKTTGGAASMPPGKNVPADEKLLLTEWLGCGAPSGKQRIGN